MKDQRSFKAGMYRIGFGFTVIAGVCLVTACGGPFPGYFTENEWNGNVRIPLSVFASLYGADRSVYNDVAVKELIDYYEVIFRKSDGSAYYRGIAEKGRKYLTLTVPVGDDYKVLLLAGNSSYGTLLASAYAGDVDIGLGTNTVSMTMSLIKINAEDLSITKGTNTTVSILTSPASAGAYRYIELSKGDTNIVLAVNFHGQLANLAAAEGATGTVTAVSNVLTILPYQGSNFPLYVESDNTSLGSSSLSYKPVPVIPSNDATGIAHFEIKYRAFGDAASGGRTWSITSGLNFGEVDIKDGIGGGILVIVGDGGGTVVLPL
jgi:hypothetical protein